MKFAVLSLSLVSVLAVSAFADDKPAVVTNQLLVKVSNDRNNGISQLVAVVAQDGKIQNIRYDAPADDETPARTMNITLGQLSNAKGVVLLNKRGYDAVILNGTVDIKAGIGQMNIKYLTSAFSGSYASCPALVRRTTEGQWQLMNAYTKKQVKEIAVVSHFSGIRTIKGLCQ